jgi:hypothetical protein
MIMTTAITKNRHLPDCWEICEEPGLLVRAPLFLRCCAWANAIRFRASMESCGAKTRSDRRHEEEY